MLAIVLSLLFPGLGQLYYGKWIRAALMVILGVTLLYPVALVWSVIDAYRLSRSGAQPQLSAKESLAAIVLVGVVVPVCMLVLVLTSAGALAWLQDAHLNRSATLAEGAEIATTLAEYREAQGRYPDKLALVVAQRPLRAGWLTDGWGRLYRYRVNEAADTFQLLSAGRDGQFETEDDLEWKP
jgi:hypothetical protein